MKRMITYTKHLTVPADVTRRSTVFQAFCATTMSFAFLAASSGGHSQATHPGRTAKFEQASVFVAPGNSCVLHPQDNVDPSQSLNVRSDADGVLRFQAVRPALPNSIDRLAIECVDSKGYANTYSVDLRSEETFTPRPFSPSLANLTLRPALAGDPLSLTQDQLVEAGYGVRPDPAGDPTGYKTWLAAARLPAYKLRSAPRAVPARQRAQLNFSPTLSAGPNDPIALDASVFPTPSNYWTGPMLSGSYQKNATSATTYSYVENLASFVVPGVAPRGFGTKSTAMTIWNGLDNVFQAIVDVNTTSATANYGIHRQNFYHNQPVGNIDEQGVDFVPNAGDLIVAQEWYCDSKGHVKMAGGYGCSIMIDETQNIEWECDQSNSTECQSYPIESTFLTNGALGQTAEFIIEDDTAETAGNCPSKSNCYDEWVDFSPVTMTGSALVVQGTAQTGKSVTTSTDPIVTLFTDNAASAPFVRGDGHLLITLPTGAAKWSEVPDNIYYWNGVNFNTLATPQGTSNARPGVIFGCASSISVGPDSHGLTNGTPWITGCNAQPDGNYDVYEMQTGGAWVLMQRDVATQLAVSPEGIPWAINAKGAILYWNGSQFVPNPTGGCATWISAGPNSYGLKNGTPWITGCHAYADGNYDVFQMQTGGKWVKIQSDAAVQISISPEGSFVWGINSYHKILAAAAGDIFIQPLSAGEVSPGGCVTSIAAGPSLTPWFVSCFYSANGFVGEGQIVYQLQLDGTVKEMQSNGGTQIAMSPSGNQWLISSVQ